jgi:hypothetical protein
LLRHLKTNKGRNWNMATKRKIIKWEEGKMHLQPGKTYSMTGAELVDMGWRVDTDGYLIATTLTYTVELGVPWRVHQMPKEVPKPFIIKKNTPFKKVQDRYPDAIKGIFISNKPMEYVQQGLFQVFRFPNVPEQYAKLLYRSITPIKGGKEYRNIYIFSKDEAKNIDFRFHAGSLADSLETLTVVTSMGELRDVIEKRYGGERIKGDLEFTNCTWDERINWLSYNVVGNIKGYGKHVIGQSNGRIIQ